MSRKYPQVYDGDWVMPKRRGYRMMCCDCGLVHRINFRIDKKNGRAYLLFQAFRDKKATASARRRPRKRKPAQ